MSYTASQLAPDAPFGHAFGEGAASDKPSGSQMHYHSSSEMQTYYPDQLGSLLDPNYTGPYDVFGDLTLSHSLGLTEQGVVQPQFY